MGSKIPTLSELVLGTNLVSRTKQALINICSKARQNTSHFSLFSGPALECHVPYHFLSTSPTVAFQLFLDSSHCSKSPTSFADPRCCGLCSGKAWKHSLWALAACRRAFLLADPYCRARFCPPSPSFWMPTDARANVSGEIRGRQSCFLRVSAPPPRGRCSSADSAPLA